MTIRDFAPVTQTVQGEAWAVKETSPGAVVFIADKLVLSVDEFAAWAHKEYGHIEDAGADYIGAAVTAYTAYTSNPAHDFVYFDVTIGEKSAGRMVFELFTDICPKTCANFKVCISAMAHKCTHSIA